jgi:two-component system LytT family sensor kinase
MNISRKILFRKNTVIIHILIWAVILLLPFIFSSENQHSRDSDDIAFRNLNAATIIFWMGLFYLNAAMLIPSFIYKKKYLQYIVALIFLFCIVMALHGTLFPLLVPGHDFNFFRSSVHNLVPFIFTITVSTTYKILLDKIKADAVANERQRENLRSELSFLRSQISPHFLFNVLNNIVAMVRIKSDELEPTVIKLSGLLQYMLYETDEEKVLIKNEVEYLQSYIDLQQMRFSSKLNMQVQFDVKEEWESIEPMLLVPFIENAFKHGNGLQKNPEIHISLKVDNGLLDFQVRNKFVPLDKSKDRISGIGLSNVRRRLDLLYENKHTLNIEESGEWFTVHLQIILRK